MTHRAGDDFFEKKKQWSKRKDDILGRYLAAYLPKIMRLGRPVLIVDGFAGPGTFLDGEKGSPLIICHCIQKTLSKNLKVPQSVKLWCVENKPAFFSELKKNISPFEFAIAKFGTFSDYADEISEATKSHSVFLYVDPFTVDGLDWNELEKIFLGLASGSSVEILLNLNSSSFLRQGLAALKTKLEKMEEDDTTADPVDAETLEQPQLAKLDSIVGGAWWQELVRQKKTFPETVTEFTREFCNRLREHFKEVGFHPVKAAPHHNVAKYFLIYGTRHLDGLELMNDEMVKSRRVLADMAKPKKQKMLIETRSEELVPDLDRLPGIVLSEADVAIKRKDLIQCIIKKHFCEFHHTEIRGCVEQLLKSNQLKSETGKSRINQDVHVWVPSSHE